jgi:hypothetical protein
LFILRGSLRFEARELEEFLDYFFVRHPSPALEDVPCHVEAAILCGPGYSSDLLPVISVLRRYPLLEITWFELHYDCGVEEFISRSNDVNFLKSFLEEMDAQHFENLLAVKIITKILDKTAGLSIVMGRGFPIRTVKEWERTLRGFNVTIRRTDCSTRVLSNLDSDDDCGKEVGQNQATRCARGSSYYLRMLLSL